MGRVLAVSIACLAYVGLAAAQSNNATTGSVERAFKGGGQIRMDLSAGDYRIAAGRDDLVRVEWRVKNPDQAREVTVTADVEGTRARITTDGPSNNFSVRIQVPVRSDLYVRLTAGDMDVEGIDGNKDIELRAGDLTIDLRRVDDYNEVEASVLAGDLEIRPLNVSKGGLFRSYKWTGKGPYRLHAHLLAGDLRIR